MKADVKSGKLLFGLLGGGGGLPGSCLTFVHTSSGYMDIVFDKMKSKSRSSSYVSLSGDTGGVGAPW